VSQRKGSGSSRADAGSEAALAAGLELLAEVASFLSTTLAADDVLSRVAGAVERSVGGRCRVWVRTPDGASFQALTPPGERAPPLTSADEAARWVEDSNARPDGTGLIRVPLTYNGERLGLLEVTVPDQPAAAVLRRAVRTIADILSPLLASFELSEDLASEIAQRTREVEAQRRFWAKIIDSLPVGLYVIDRDYRIQAWNRTRETGTQGVGRDEVIGRTVFEVLHRQPRALLRREFDRAFSTGQLEQIEVESSASGEVRHYRLTKVPMRLHDDAVTHVINIGEDITEWKRVQQQVAQTERLAAVGQLAAGVMHEINNPLATIGACVEALNLRCGDLTGPLAQNVEEYLHIIESELARCKSIVDGLLDFSRPKARLKRAVPVNSTVEDALFLIRHHHRFKGITLHRELADGLPDLYANSEQLIQVFLSIMLNAIDAMEGRGQLTVRTFRSRERRDEVVVEFTDTGAGIPREDLDKIFEPFFTTKLPGRGTGLGLSICYGIVQEHGGRMVVDSRVGQGSVFRVVLPVGGAAEGER
jgi:two-component system NtrC family sensor kinase